jgi:hypothetical protein
MSSSSSGAQPAAASSSASLPPVPTLNSWPHFSSINSLNNLGILPGVKSIASLSSADLVQKGAVNKMGNLAQVKSMESMGKNDSYAFLEIFFGDRSSTNLSLLAGAGNSIGTALGGSSTGMRDLRMRTTAEDDDEIGLSLEDETPTAQQQQQQPNSQKKEEFPVPASTTSMAGTLVSSIHTIPVAASNDSSPAPDRGVASTNTLKRAFDDAFAARGLMAVSRSSERLTDLALPAKMQRTLSQDFLRKHLEQQDTFHQQQAYGQFGLESSNDVSKMAGTNSTQSAQQPQHSGQAPGEPQQNSGLTSSKSWQSVPVPSETKCALCHQTNVDTQLRPCGHMFHEVCLKKSLCSGDGQPPKCPCDNVAIQSALLAVPTADASATVTT